MSAVLSLTIPFFALIFLGMICRRVGFVGPDDARTLSRFAFFVAMPVMVFVKIGAGNAMEILNWGFVWRYELATALVFVGTARYQCTVPVHGTCRELVQRVQFG